MSQDTNRFSADVKRTLWQRASTTCSNPNCRKTTHGPSGDVRGVVNIGVAAHIYGANPGSARYIAAMSPNERSAITNGIWLCNDCAKLVDDDETVFTVEILYEWKRDHEEEIRRQLGYTTGERETISRIKNAYSNELGAALQIALDKPINWEWLLFILMWRDRTQRALNRHDLLRRGLIYKPRYIVPALKMPAWIRRKAKDLEALVLMLHEIITVEIPKGLGDPGKPGDEMSMLSAMNLLSSLFDSLIDCDLDSRISIWHRKLDHLRDPWMNLTPSILSQLDYYPNEMERRINAYTRTGQDSDATLSVTLTMPEEILQSVLSINQVVLDMTRNGELTRDDE